MKTGAFVALSWPDTRIRNASSWYDGPMKVLGICKSDGYYNVGHAALLLIDYRSGEVRYFDFGRYHTPFGFGRVRDQESDPELGISTIAELSDQQVTNLSEILYELDQNPSTHGDGKLVAAITLDIDYDMAIASAKSYQAREAVPYGPFQPMGSNCSRFVASIYRSGFRSYFKKRRIANWYLYFHTPTSNIIYTNSGDNVHVIEHGQHRIETSMWDIFTNKSKVLPPANLPEVDKSQIPQDAYCLTGTGGDAYFLMQKTDKSHLFRVKRYSENGWLEFDDIFQLQTIGFDIRKAYEYTYISTCISIKIEQNGQTFTLKNVNYQNKQLRPKTLKQRLLGRSS